MNDLGTRFDESLAAVAGDLHLGSVTLAAMASAVLLFAWLERRGRRQWARVPLANAIAGQDPYRSSAVVVVRMARAPAFVRAAAFGSLAFGHLFAPLVVLAMIRCPFEVIAIPLIPGMGIALANWTSAWLMLARAPRAASAARSGALGSLMANIGLLGIAGVHFLEVEMQRRDGIEHACSSSVTFIVFLFAAASVLQALLILAAVHAHEQALRWMDPTDRGASSPGVVDEGASRTSRQWSNAYSSW
jgi:hypothetical protein